MSHPKQHSTRKRNSKATHLLGAAESFSLVSRTLGEEEISDVSLATYVFDNENGRTSMRGIKFGAGGCGGCGCSH